MNHVGILLSHPLTTQHQRWVLLQEAHRTLALAELARGIGAHIAPTGEGKKLSLHQGEAHIVAVHLFLHSNTGGEMLLKQRFEVEGAFDLRKSADNTWLFAEEYGGTPLYSSQVLLKHQILRLEILHLLDGMPVQCALQTPLSQAKFLGYLCKPHSVSFIQEASSGRSSSLCQQGCHRRRLWGYLRNPAPA